MENQYNEQQNMQGSVPAARDRFALFSLIAGILAIIGSTAIFPGILLGIGGITLGIISRINYEKFNLHNVLGITFGGIAIFLSGVIFLGMISLMKEPEVMAQLQEMMQKYYGY